MLARSTDGIRVIQYTFGPIGCAVVHRLTEPGGHQPSQSRKGLRRDDRRGDRELVVAPVFPNSRRTGE